MEELHEAGTPQRGELAAAQQGASLKRFSAALMAWGTLGVFLLAVADSAGIPVPGGVDALVVAATAAGASPWLVGLAAIGGSLIGNLILFTLARKGGEKYLERKASGRRARQFITWFQQYGVLTLFVPAVVPVVPLPLKIFVISAGALGLRLRVFVAVILAARIPRYGGLAWLGHELGTHSLDWLVARKWHLLIFSVVLFVVLAILVEWKARRNRAMAEAAKMVD